MKALLALAVALLIALPAVAGQAPLLPWKSYADIPGIDGGPACQGTATIILISDEWQVLSNDTKDIFMHLTNGKPDYIYFTQGTRASGIMLTRVLPFAEAQKRYPDPCVYLREVSL